MLDFHKLANTPIPPTIQPVKDTPIPEHLRRRGQNMVKPPPPNAGQAAAIKAILEWLENPSDNPYFILKGPAGTGKTFVVKSLVDLIRGKMAFTAPTNKATRVLRESFEGTGYKPFAKTIFSLLGLRLSPNGEIKELTKAEKSADEDYEELDLSTFRCIVLDECGMCSTLLKGYMDEAIHNFGVRFLLMGDPFQWNPVGEALSPLWELEKEGVPVAELTEPMRHQGPILELATTIRQRMLLPTPHISIQSKNDGDTGVWYGPKATWERDLLAYAKEGLFHDGTAKAIAWRNARVDELNIRIRTAFMGPRLPDWVESDRVIFTEPAKNLEGKPMAATDDEGTVIRVSTDFHPIIQWIKVWNVDIELDTGSLVTARVLHADSRLDFERESQSKASLARANPRLWREFWEFKENFHSLRHALALTSHRSQGSTYKYVFCDMGDLLSNRDRKEGFRGLYVGASRAKERLIIA